MEPNQVHVVAAAVFRDSEQFIHALESRFASQIIRHVSDGNRLDRIHDDVTLVHRVPATDLYVRIFPDADTALDFPVPYSLAKPFGEHHMNLTSMRSKMSTKSSLTPPPD